MRIESKVLCIKIFFDDPGRERMFIKVTILVLFFALMIAIGIYCRKHATDVKGFVLGGRSVGPWLTAFAYGTSYFSAVVFVSVNS